MDVDTIEICWEILQQYVKSSDRSHAISHLVGELLDSGLRDEDLKKLKQIDQYFSNAAAEHEDFDLDDEDMWE